MEVNNTGCESILQKLKDAEAIVDDIITELDALYELTGKNGPLNKLLDKILLTHSQAPYSETLKRRKDKLRKVSKKKGKPRGSKS